MNDVDNSSIQNVIKLTVLMGVGILFFLIPIKFGLPLNPASIEFPKNWMQWLVFPWPQQIWQITIVVLTALWMFKALAAGKIVIKYSILDLWVFVFLGTAVFSTFGAANIQRAEECLTLWFGYALCYWLLLQIISDENDLKWFLGVIIVPAILISLYGIFQFYVGLPSTRQWAALYMDGGSFDVISGRLASNRVFSTFIYPNTLAGYILLVLPCALLLPGIGIKQHEMFWKKMALSGFLMAFVLAVSLGAPQFVFIFFIGLCFYPLAMIYAYYLTYSKGGYLLLLVVMCLLGIYGYLKLIRKKRVLVMMLSAFALVVLLFCLFGYGLDFVGKAKGALVTRWEYWHAGVSIIKEYPVLGVGPDNFSSYYPLYKLTIAEEVQHVHNNFLQIWIEQGIFGFLAFCALWLTVIIKGFRGLGRGQATPARSLKWLVLLGLVAGLVGSALHNIGDFDWYVPGLTIIVWCFFALVIWLSGRYKEKVFLLKTWPVKLLYFVLIILLCGSVLIYLERSVTAEYYLKEGEAAFRNKNYELAEVTGRVAMKMDSNNPEVYYLLGRISEQKNNYAESIRFYQMALLHDRNNASYYHQIAQAYRQYMQLTKDFSHVPSCRQALEDSVALYPTRSFYRLHLAQLYEANRQYKKAIKEYELCYYYNQTIKAESEKREKILGGMMLSEDVMEFVKKRIADLKNNID